MEKLYKKLEEYGKSDHYPFHMPGHKRNKNTSNGDFPFEKDITEISGFDDLHHPEGIIRKAQEDLARLYGTEESFFSVNGSTAALLAAISASVKKGGHILIGRNCHKAVYHAIYLRELEPTYIYPHTDPVLGINGGILPGRVERCLEEDPDIEAVLITSPTYDGIVSDVEAIAEIVHRYRIPLIVDEAHGAHFRFSDYFPASAAELGADLVIQSLHKTLPSMTQTAVLHRCSHRADREKIKRFMGIYQSSSPSYVLMASIDACVDMMERNGKEMFREFTGNLEKARERLSRCTHIRLIPPAGGEDPAVDVISGAFAFDRSKLILSTSGSSLTGKELGNILREEFHIETEMETEHYLLALTSVGDTREGFSRLCGAIEEIDRRESLKNTEKKETETEQKGDHPYHCSHKKRIMTISAAMDAPSICCPLEESVGKISAEFACLYPPGIPLIVPGEQITGRLVRNLKRYVEQGLNLRGLCDEKKETIRIVKE